MLKQLFIFITTVTCMTGLIRSVPSGFGTSPLGFGTSSSGFGTSSSGFSTSPLGFGTSSSGFGTSSSGFGTSQSGFGTSASECRNMMDLVLVVDGSDSISTEDYVKQRVALSSLIKELNLGPQQTRVGIVVYSSTIAQIINITHNLDYLINSTTNLLHPRDGTETSLGIATAKQLFRDSGRANVPWVCIVITDGLSKYPALTAEEAAGARDMGVNMFAVGISHFIQQSELEAIASSPQQVLMLKTFDQLRTSLLSLMKIVCPCPLPPEVPNGMYDDGPRSIGSSRIITCEPGYQPMGDPTITCLPDAKWSTLRFSCVACPPPPVEYGNGLIADGPNTIDTVREYICKTGFSSQQPIQTTCITGPDGPSWTVPQFVCQGCPSIIPLANGYYEPPVSEIVIGTVVLYTCSPGYIATGHIESTCIATNGIPTWTKPIHTCIACGPPPQVAFATVDDQVHALVGTVRVYTCNAGYHPTGPIEATCMGEKGSTYWHLNRHTCRASACGPLPDVPNAEVLPGDHTLGAVRNYKCLHGYVPDNRPEITCLREAKWSPINFRCIASCSDPYPIDNTVLEPGENFVGSIRKFTCLPGYFETGPITSTCEIPPKSSIPDWSTPFHSCKDCGMPYIVDFADAVPGPVTIGSVQKYICHEGYVATGPPNSYCMQNGEWSPPDFNCITCREPPVVDLAEVDKVGTSLVNSVRTYMCNKGYVATGPILYKCIVDDLQPFNLPQWVKQTDNYCKDCGMPPNVANAYSGTGTMTVGSTRDYRCDDGYELIGWGVIQCQLTGVWSQPQFTCKLKAVPSTTPLPKINLYCPLPPPTIEFADVEPGTNLVGTNRRYQCHKGFTATGPITIDCLPGAEWSRPLHSCKASCGPLPKVLNADFLPGDHTLGAVRNYKCHHGFVPDNRPEITCLKGGIWSPIGFNCIGCTDPYSIDHAVLEPGDNLVGSIRRFTCLPGYYETGPITSTCAVQPRSSFPDWSMPVHFCKDCGEPYVVPYAYAEPGPRTIGSIQRYVCHEGYVPTGPPNSHCMQNAEWTPPEFKCISNAKLGECLDLVGHMYKVKFDTKNNCVKPIVIDDSSNGNGNGKLIYGK